MFPEFLCGSETWETRTINVEDQRKTDSFHIQGDAKDIMRKKKLAH